jgi:hypothetical protein
VAEEKYALEHFHEEHRESFELLFRMFQEGNLRDRISPQFMPLFTAREFVGRYLRKYAEKQSRAPVADVKGYAPQEDGHSPKAHTQLFFGSQRDMTGYIALSLDPSRKDTIMWDWDALRGFTWGSPAMDQPAFELTPNEIQQMDELKDVLIEARLTCKVHPLLGTNSQPDKKMIFLQFRDCYSHVYVHKSSMSVLAAGKWITRGGTHIPGGGASNLWGMPQGGGSLEEIARLLAQSAQRIYSAFASPDQDDIDRHGMMVCASKVGPEPGREPNLGSGAGGNYGSLEFFMDSSEVVEPGCQYPHHKWTSTSAFRDFLRYGKTWGGTKGTPWSKFVEVGVWKWKQNRAEQWYMTPYDARMIGMIVPLAQVREFIQGVTTASAELDSIGWDE